MAGITVSGVTIDAAEPAKLAAWWAKALDWDLDGNTCRAPGSGLQRLEFMPVPESKHVKNRVHIDFGADDVQAAVDRLVAMGATFAWEEDFHRSRGTATWSSATRRGTSSVWADRRTPRPDRAENYVRGADGSGSGVVAAVSVNPR